MVTLAPAHSVGLERDAAAARRTHDVRAARAVRTAKARLTWWQWLDFDSKVMAQVWSICCAQILILVIGGLVIHASAASPY